tara:strand:- start:1882 stop:2211 length:330 start_codon:yes stop_codon:yes gene_type:complete
MEKLDSKTQKVIAELQEVNQKMQGIAMQKHSFQTQLLEIENALNELEDAKESYKLVGSIVLSVEKKELKKELSSKKEILDLRLSNFDKQENKLKKDIEKLQSKIKPENE